MANQNILLNRIECMIELFSIKARLKQETANENKCRLQKGPSNGTKIHNDITFVIRSPYLAHRLVMSNRLSPATGTTDTADGGGSTATG